jgi:hypothetical protein
LDVGDPTPPASHVMSASCGFLKKYMHLLNWNCGALVDL